MHQIPGIEEVCLTTNGVLLPDLAPALYEAGLRHLNISLDTLRRERYREITGKDNWREVMAGLKLALALGFQPLKINCVVLKGINDDELMDLALLARDYPVQVRFIELMPTVSREWWRRHFLSMTAVHHRLAGLGRLSPVIPAVTDGPARVFRVPGFQGELGFISPMSNHHCESCNRLRLTAAGQLRPCLLRAMELNLKVPLRLGLPDRSLACIFHEAIRLKTRRSEYSLPKGEASFPTMASIGGIVHCLMHPKFFNSYLYRPGGTSRVARAGISPPPWVFPLTLQVPLYLLIFVFSDLTLGIPPLEDVQRRFHFPPFPVAFPDAAKVPRLRLSRT